METITIGEHVCVGRRSDLLHTRGGDTLDERGSYGGTVLLRGLQPSYRCRPGRYVASNPHIPNEDPYSKEKHPFVEAYLVHHDSLAEEVLRPFYLGLTWMEEDIVERPRYIGRYDWGDWSEGKDGIFFVDAEAVPQLKESPDACAEELKQFEQGGAVCLLKGTGETPKGFLLLPAMEYKYGVLFLNELEQVEALLVFDRYGVHDHGSLALSNPFQGIIDSDPGDACAQESLRFLQARPWETRDADLADILQRATGLAAESLYAEYAGLNLRHYQRLLRKCYLAENKPDEFLWRGDVTKRECLLLTFLGPYLRDDLENDPDWFPWMAEDLQFEDAEVAEGSEPSDLSEGGAELVQPPEGDDLAAGLEEMELSESSEEQDFTQFTLQDWAVWVHPADKPWEYGDIYHDVGPLEGQASSEEMEQEE